MEHTRIITGITSQLRLPAMLLEDIVNHRTRTAKYSYPVTGIERSLYCSDLNTILTYTIETTIKGNLQIEAYNNNSNTVELILVPVASSFLVTCAKGKENKYKLEFSTSLN
jgi:hypothetical protein